ncbi:MAG: hypothetical protein ACK57B_11950 [Betaproteobacteria bacterium]|jgi:hypothetical protein
MKPSEQAVVVIVLGALAVVLSAVSWVLGVMFVLGVAGASAIVIVFLPRWIISLGERAHGGWRSQLWKRAEGRHHAFAGVPFDIVDDGRHVWMHGDALKRVLARPEADDVLAARISGKWKIDGRQRLWLRVDGVVEHLASFPGRMDPRVQRLRRWLERDVIYPAERRHAR